MKQDDLHKGMESSPPFPLGADTGINLLFLSPHPSQGGYRNSHEVERPVNSPKIEIVYKILRKSTELAHPCIRICSPLKLFWQEHEGTWGHEGMSDD